MRPAASRDIIVTKWGARFMGRQFPCAIGRGGISDDKHEGDGATPRGVHALPEIWTRPDRITAPQTNHIRPRDIWCDAPEHLLYNNATQSPLPASHEKLRRADPLYNVIIVTDWNWPKATPHKGSAIFIHRWRKPRHPTEGCVAFHPRDLNWIIRRLTPTSRLIVR